MRREAMLKEAERVDFWDVIVIGGGATGLWCAYDAALRGFRTILIEQADFASATSSKSTKLIHGGIRYLKQGQLLLVHEALHERRILSTIAPHLVHSRSFILPYYKWHERPYYGLGMSLYDFLAGPLGEEAHQFLQPSEVLTRCPTLDADNLRGGCLFTDGQFDDARFAIELAKMAALHEATLLNYTKVTSFIKQEGRIEGVIARDLINDQEMEIHGKVVINASGIFSDEIRRLDEPTSPPMMAFSRGSHIVLDKEFLSGETALIFPKLNDGRLAFCIPWHNKVLVGTTDVATDRPLQEPHPTHEEIEFLLNAAGQYLSKKPQAHHIRSAFAGIRPLVKRSTTPTAKLSRSHKVSIGKSHLITVAGGKWTTARRMAEDTIDHAIGAGLLENITCKTMKMPFDEMTHSHKGEKLHPALPYTDDDFKIAIEHEMAQTLTDLLARRTRSLFLDVKATLEIAPTVARSLQKYLAQTDAFREEQIETFTTFARPYSP